ncbi:sirohydrochlorin chelatase [Actinomadura viridis]|uniref:Sirohydrochlorin ferrochelatase n=1 Tax=Actinomadura viridis TaxID=58110 RepID=A0A931GL10_9ACTN|nr:sirohydrochlorin chelatase [Actinomadura viridis]MBG6090947.1 sirohydrochlorin ferrochelatase [Actinomadura viridis]
MRHPPVTLPPLTARPPMVAVAHGSKDPRAAATVEELLSAVRARRPAVPVLTSFLDHAPPAPGPVLEGLLARDAAGGGPVVVLPLLLTAAYHSKTDVPGVLAQVRRRHPRARLRTAATLGPHPLLVAALERRLAEAGVEIGDPDTAVVLVSAGSSDPSANATIRAMAREWRGRGWRDVVAAYASAAGPAPAAAVRGLYEAGASRVVVASYFLAPGYFADKVRRESLAAGAAVVSPVLGAAPEVAELVLLRYTEALTAAPAAAAV